LSTADRGDSSSPGPLTPNPGSLAALEPGRVEYARALELQRRLVDLRLRDEIPDTLVLLEHPPVLTLGRNRGPENLLVSEEELRRRGVSVHKVERGGDITFHGPGQLVGYPVFRLKSGLVGVRRFVELVQQALVHALAGLGVEARPRPGHIGVWVEDRKIASLGIAVRHGVTFHGFALNVSTDLSWFRLINPCGMSADVMTSVTEENGEGDWDTACRLVVESFEKRFGLRRQAYLPRSLTSLTNRPSS